MKVDFYHLTLSPVDRVLPRIAQKILDSGERLLIIADDEDRRGALDRSLWAFSPESFLPHAQAGGENDAAQPVLIAPDLDASNGARNVAIADAVWREDALGFDRAFHFFDEENIAAARTAWKSLGDHSEVERRYWQQTDGGGWRQAG